MRNNMKIYRFVYEFGSIRTERFFQAKSKKELNYGKIKEHQRPLRGE